MEFKPFELVSSFAPMGDQPEAIDTLVDGLEQGLSTCVLLGVTGSGKTFTMANIIAKLQRPALIIAHNKTLAAQLCNEFREFFPNNRVEYFVSYYDYYQPEAYIPKTDTYIAKELDINDEIDKLRHSATSSLCERRDTIVVASVSCIYGLGAPMEYYSNAISLRENDELDRDALIDRLIHSQYNRADMDFDRGTFRVRGDVIDIFPISYSNTVIRVEFFGDTIEKISEMDLVTGVPLNTLKHINIFPATHFMTRGNAEVLEQIARDMLKREEEFIKQGKLIEAQRIRERVSYDLEMIREIGYCSGIENYSRYFDGRAVGSPPYTLMDFFPKDYLVFVDESHMTLPQIRGMYNGDKARKANLVDFGFRLPAAFDNRPLTFDEFNGKLCQMVCVSATPQQYELSLAGVVAEQLIRPTGLIDPPVYVRPTKGQIEDLIGEINKAIDKKGRVLITTLTIKMAEDLTAFLKEHSFKVQYMHTDTETLERIQILTALRNGDLDILVGINLLREGLDLPEVCLVAILDADKEGFLRSETSLVQTIGRTARNAEGYVIMYADVITGSMQRAIDETNRRREKQMAYNKLHNITPVTIKKSVTNTISISQKAEPIAKKGKGKQGEKRDLDSILYEIDKLTKLMKVAASQLDFELALQLKNQIAALKALL